MFSPRGWGAQRGGPKGEGPRVGGEPKGGVEVRGPPPSPPVASSAVASPPVASPPSKPPLKALFGRPLFEAQVFVWIPPPVEPPLEAPELPLGCLLGSPPFKVPSSSVKSTHPCPPPDRPSAGPLLCRTTQNFALFCFSTNFRSFLPSGGLLVELWRGSKPWPTQVRVWAP